MKNLKHSTIVLWIFAIIFLVSSLSLLTSGQFGAFITGLIIVLILSFFGWKISFKQKTSTKQAVVSSYTNVAPTPVAKNNRVELPSTISGYHLNYHYDDFVVSSSCNYDQIHIGEQVTFTPEPSNPHDSNAISIMCNNTHIGYFPKNRIQQMFHDYQQKDSQVIGFVRELTSNTIILSIGFYTSFAELKMKLMKHSPYKSFKLTGTSSQELQENISLCDVGDNVTFDYSYEKNKLSAICDTTIGYLSSKHEEYINSLTEYRAYIEDMSTTSNEKTSVTVIVFEQ